MLYLFSNMLENSLTSGNFLELFPTVTVLKKSCGILGEKETILANRAVSFAFLKNQQNKSCKNPEI